MTKYIQEHCSLKNSSKKLIYLLFNKKMIQRFLCFINIYIYIYLNSNIIFLKNRCSYSSPIYYTEHVKYNFYIGWQLKTCWYNWYKKHRKQYAFSRTQLISYNMPILFLPLYKVEKMNGFFTILFKIYYHFFSAYHTQLMYLSLLVIYFYLIPTYNL